MGKRLIHDYQFKTDSNKITLNEIITQDRFLLITNTTDGENLYSFNNVNNGINNISFDYDNTQTTVQFKKDTSAMDSSDVLQIFIEAEATPVEFSETYIDPVAKVRVSQPENLIDTDFEYGLQSTKWETLELVNNIPTFFSRNGDLDLTLSTISVIANSDVVTVTTTEAHGLSRGTPILVQGTKDNKANGGFVVTSTLDDNTFEYKAKQTFSTSRSIIDTYSQVFVASVYQGTEFDLESLNAVTSDEGSTSKLTVKTKYPTAFSEGTSFFLTNSMAKANLTFQGDSTGIDPRNTVILNQTTGVNNVATGEDDEFLHGVVHPFSWIPYDESNNTLRDAFLNTMHRVYFNEEDLTYSGTNNSIVTFPDPHGFTTTYNTDVNYQRGGQWITGAGATSPTGVNTGTYTTEFFWFRVVDQYSIQLFQTGVNYGNTNTNYVFNVGTVSGVSNGITKSCIQASIPIRYQTGTTAYPIYAVDYYTNYLGPQRAGSSLGNISTVRDYYFTQGPERWLMRTYASSTPGSLNTYDFSNTPPTDLYSLNNSGILTTNASYGLVYPWYNNTRDFMPNYQQYRFGTPRDFKQGVSVTTWSTDNNPDTNDYAYNYLHLYPMQKSAYGNSVYLASHGYETGDIVSVSAVTGTLPTGLTAGTYSVVKLNDDRISFRTLGGSDIIFTSAGSTDLTINFRVVQLNSVADTIYLQGNTLSNGDAVEYTNNGSTDIPGLTSGETYYVFEKTTDRIKLATTPTGLSDSADKTQIIYGRQFHTETYPNSSTDRLVWYSRGSGHPFTSGDIVKATQIGGTPGSLGIQDGYFYWIKSIDAYNIELYPSDSDRVAGTNLIDLSTGSTAQQVKLQKSTLVDLTGYDSGTHTILGNFIGAADGVYSLDSSYESAGQSIFTLSNVNQILRRSQDLDQLKNVDLKSNALRIDDHGFITGNDVLYQSPSGTVIGGLTDSASYYVKRISKDWFRLYDSSGNIGLTEDYSVSLTSHGTGTSRITGTSIVGETSGVGTISLSQNSNIVLGSGTLFTSVFNSGDDFNIYLPPKIDTFSISSVSVNALDLTTTGLETEDAVIIGGDVAPSGTTLGNRYYVKQIFPATVTLHPTPADATANTNTVTISSAGTNATLIKQVDIGRTIEKSIDYVNSTNKLELTSDFTDSATDSASYGINSKLLIRADGFALHRPYDGGVELIPSTNPDSQMIRQTRKYFRYQSGKGLQVSLAINFKPSVDIEGMTRSADIATITTREAHRINIADSNDGVDIIVSGATNGSDYWNGTHRVTSIPTDNTFTVKLDGTPSNVSATGVVKYVVDKWRNCSLRAGLYDDQNGLFFEFDGNQLYACIRNSTQQISGTSSVEFKSGNVVGSGTKYTEQLSVNENIVIKGQTYKITKISSDVLMHITPSYRGTNATGVIITKIEERRVPQSEWNLDKCDGTGKTGFKLDLTKIQMAYIDYSWYGAGKVRFGFKNQHGVVRYCHEFVHGNFQTEAYMRSGNMPGRYELSSTGSPTYVPALAHWGTSVIMDGRFDDDKAYIFTANSLTSTLLPQAGGADSDTTLTASGSIESNSDFGYVVWSGSNYRDAGYAIRLDNPSNDFNAVSSGMAISGTGVSTTAKLANPNNGSISPYQPYLFDYWSAKKDTKGRYFDYGYRSLLLMDQSPTSTGVSDNYVITIQEASGGSNEFGTNTNVSKDIPIISIRLSPSVDTNTPGFLGEREVLNRMQLILNEVDILTTHALEVELRLNSLLDNNQWSRVTNPSLSQLIYHSSTDNISGGTTVFSFNAQGSSQATRTSVLTAKTLGEVATLGNSILGGNGVFPDGPDVLTVVATLKEDPSTVTSDNPLSVQGRISWSESQA